MNNILFFVFLGLLIILVVCNRIYVKRTNKINQEKLKNIQLALWGYAGSPSKIKRKELYDCYLSVYKKQCQKEDF